MKTKKIIAFILAMGLVSCFAGCDKSENSSPSETTESTSSVEDTTTASTEESTEETLAVNSEEKKYEDLDDGIIMKISDFDVTEDEYKYYFAFAKSNIDGGDESYWENDPDSAKLEDLKQQTVEYIFNAYTIYQIASDNNVEITEEDLLSVDKEYEASKLYYEAINSDTGKKFDEYLKEIFCTEEVYKESIKRFELEYKTVASLYEQDFKDKHFSNYICIKHIQIDPKTAYETDENNESTDTPKNFYEINPEYTYTDEEKAVIEKINSCAKAKDAEGVNNALTELMSVIQSRLAEGETMDSLMDKYNKDAEAQKNKDGVYVGYYINKSSMSEDFSNVAFALEENQISDPVFFDEYGHCIIQRVPFNRDELISIYMSDVEYPYSTEYATLIQETQKTMDIVFSSDYNSLTSDYMKNGIKFDDAPSSSESESESETTENEETSDTSESTEETTASSEAE